MRYLIAFKNDTEPFFTKWYQYENHFVYGMIVFDLEKNVWTDNGVDWKEIEQDHL